MSVLVETKYGNLSGIQNEKHQSFLGIPYAAPPVRSLRFCAPQAPESWEGVREATQFSASCLQQESTVQGMTADGPLSEDCLYLNVFTPQADGSKRPVMFWIHGGGYVYGSSNSATYNGGALAERGDVVVVSINYRLGLFGYLYLGAHGGKEWGASANCGQLDQIAALRWVQENIAHFGGDPSNVTIFGESAGAGAVITLMAMPEARGLFQRAISQSGSVNAIQQPEGAAQVTEEFLAQLGVDPVDTKKLQELPAEVLLEAQPGLPVGSSGPMGGGLRSTPVVDGDTLPRHPSDLFKNGEMTEIPFLIGSNRDEIKLFKDPTKVKPITDENLEKIVGTFKGMFADSSSKEVIDTYKQSRTARGLPSDNVNIMDAIISDQMFKLPSLRIAEAHGQAYVYLFTYESPALKGALGACHALEMAFVFGTLHTQFEPRFTGTGPDAERLSEQMMDAWLSFARNGNPNHSGLDNWPVYDGKKRATMIFDKESACCEAPFEEERALWIP
jgi:para-nitrobenzyl esterase